jgi:acyl transferase domain-containing protein/SAM-dependent methyltransferase/acyl carrier protein
LSDATLDQLKRALGALQTLRQRYEALEARQREPIALIGASCRFPGGSDNQEAYWRLLSRGIDAVRPVPEGRWPGNFYDRDAAARNTSYVREGGFLERVDLFDTQFFGIAPREADSMDPQHRMTLELAWEALEDAGWAADRLAGSQTGVFLGLMSNDYGRMTQECAEDVDIYSGTGNDASFLAGRVSYVLGLQGPSLVVSTSCSSSLVATHLAVQSLRRGECRTALAGGVSLMLRPDLFVLLSKMHALSPDGRCHSFDASANGFGRGEGGGVIVLKRLSDAIADGDRIMAVIRGSATNHDGRSNGLTAPNGAAQEALLRAALADAGIGPQEIGYLEAHGTGTALGDPIELQAAANVLRQDRAANNPLRLGTVKANMGHLEAAAGVASLLKVALVLHHRSFVPQLHFRQPNPQAPRSPSVFDIPQRMEEWEGKRIAGVSSFGMSGTNAHVVVEGWEEEPKKKKSGDGSDLVLVLSARTEEALNEQARQYAQYLETSSEAKEDIAYTAAVGRVSFEERLVVGAGDWAAKLKEFVEGKSSRGWWRGQGRERKKIAFLYSGQGAQYAGMGRELYREQPVFRAEMERLSQVVESAWGRGELERLIEAGSEEELRETKRTQAVVYAVECGLTRLWAEWGVEPDVVLGHSVGEYAAAQAAGVYGAEEGMRLIAWRGERMGQLAAGGAMAALLCREPRVREWLEAGVEIASENGPENTVVSGDADAVERVLARAERAGVMGQRLKVSHAFHSARMEPMLEEWRQYANQYGGRATKAVWLSTLTGERVEAVDGDYWRNQVRERVSYRAAVERALEAGCEVLLEVGPGSTLVGLGKRCRGGEGVQWLTSLERGKSERLQMAEAAGRLWSAGVTVNWESFYRDRKPRRVPLPTYPFQRQRHWLSERAYTTAHTNSPEHVQDLSADETYSLDWVEQPLPAATVESRIDAVLQEGAARLAAEDLDDVNQKLDRLCVVYAWAALSRWQNEFGILPSPEVAPIASQHRRLIRLLYSWAAEEGLVERNSWRILKRPSNGQINPEQIIEQHPSFAGYIRPLARCGARLAEILQGEDPLPLLFPGGSLSQVEEIYEKNKYAAVMNRAVAEAIRAIVAQTDRPVRILEVGAGSGGTTSAVLSGLDPSRFTYTFTDVSTMFLARARQKFSRHTNIEYRLYDLERDPAEQGFVPGTYDLVIAANVVHATSDVRRVLSNLRGLLTAAGQLVILEVTRPQRMIDLTFGLLEGWWKFSDLDLRPDYALMPPERWSAALLHAGFQSAVAFPRDAAAPQSVILAGNNSAIAERHKTWHIEGAGSLAEGLAQQLQTRGAALARPAEIAGKVVVVLDAGSNTPVSLCSRVLRLIQSFTTPSPQIAVVWQQTAEPATEALRAFLRCAAVEQPQLFCRWIEFSREAFDSGALARELLTTTPEQEIRLTTRRLVTRLHAHSPQAPAFRPRTDRSYLITGGFGTLGLSLADWLSANGAGELILLSRRGPTPGSEAVLQRCRLRGTRVQIERADVADRESMRNLVTEMSRRGRIGGIFHTAGENTVVPLNQLTETDIERMFTGKVRGAEILDELTSEIELDCLVLFSSAAAVWGSSRLAHYAAANGFLDGLADRRAKRGLPSLSLQFGRLSERGMVPESEYRQFDRMGLLSLPLDHAWEAMARVLASGATHCVLARVDWDRFMPVYQAQGARKTLFSELPVFKSEAQIDVGIQQESWRDLDHLSEPERADNLTQRISGLVARVLGFPSSALPLDRGLFELGLDSLTAVELRDRLSKALGVALPPTLLYEQPTVHDLSRHLLERAFAQSAVSTTAAIAALAPAVSASDVVSRLESISDEEIDRLFAERIVAQAGSQHVR